jgi:GNAT superfamily N-acetyltransferase
VIRIEQATLDHARALQLRAGDACEIAALGISKEHAIARSLERSIWAEAYLVDGEVAAIVGLGLSSLIGGHGVPWLLTGPACERHKRRFLVESRHQVDRMLAECERLVGSVHAGYGRAVRWLKWLGFAIAPAVNGFHPFEMCRGLDLRSCSVADLPEMAGFGAFAAEYAAESAIDGLPLPAARLANYLPLERVGALHTIRAAVAGRLAGVITVLAPMNPHYGVPIAVSESFFVAKPHRRTGAGLKLLRAAEDKARELGAPGLLVGAPVEGDLFKVLPRVGYRETNRVFFKKVAHA